jgi:hypothetical protein
MNMMRLRSFIRILTVAMLAAAGSSCGDVVRNSRSPVFLVIDSLTGSSGAPGSTFGSFVNSDVLTLVTSGGSCTVASPCPTFFNDVGQVTLRLAPKDIGSTTNPNSPTTNNEVTITGYRVDYRRNDGHNIAGVDVPVSFNGTVTITVPAAGNISVGFQLVRGVAKRESPLVQYITNPGVLTALADVTFYGTDRVGNAVTASGTIEVNFANFGDT